MKLLRSGTCFQNLCAISRCRFTRMPPRSPKYTATRVRRNISSHRSLRYSSEGNCMPAAAQYELRLAQRMSRLGTETAFEVLEKAKALEAQGRSIIHLEIG